MWNYWSVSRLLVQNAPVAKPTPATLARAALAIIRRHDEPRALPVVLKVPLIVVFGGGLLVPGIFGYETYFDS